MRATLFTPAAAPVSPRATWETISVASAAIAIPVPMPSRALAAYTSSAPAVTIASTPTNTRRLPYRSPRRPAIGVATAELSRNPVTVQLVWSADAPSARWIAGSAGITSDCISE